MSNLSDFIDSSGIVSIYQEFTASGTWNKDPNAQWVYVEAIGGGASGSAWASTSSSGASAKGGGGGGWNYALIRASDVPSSLSVTVGAGGASRVSTDSNLQGENGGDSSFGSLLIAKGGEGHSGTNNGRSGSGALGGLPVVNIAPQGGYAGGGGGGAADSNHLYVGGGRATKGGGGGAGTNGGGTSTYFGGASVDGGKGGDSARTTTQDADISAENGAAPGGGGGGASAYNATSVGSATSGSGGDGRVRVWQW